MNPVTSYERVPVLVSVLTWDERSSRSLCQVAFGAPEIGT
jgi:hypothetical protein